MGIKTTIHDPDVLLPDRTWHSQLHQGVGEFTTQFAESCDPVCDVEYIASRWDLKPGDPSVKTEFRMVLVYRDWDKPAWTFSVLWQQSPTGLIKFPDTLRLLPNPTIQSKWPDIMAGRIDLAEGFEVGSKSWADAVTAVLWKVVRQASYRELTHIKQFRDWMYTSVTEAQKRVTANLSPEAAEAWSKKQFQPSGGPDII